MVKLPSYNALKSILREQRVVEYSRIADRGDVLAKYSRYILLLNYAFTLGGGLRLVELAHDVFVYDGDDWYVLDTRIERSSAASEDLVYEFRRVLASRPRRVYVVATVPGVLVKRRNSVGDPVVMVTRVATDIVSYPRAAEIVDSLYPLRPRCSLVPEIDEKFKKRYSALTRKKKH